MDNKRDVEDAAKAMPVKGEFGPKMNEGNRAGGRELGKTEPAKHHGGKPHMGSAVDYLNRESGTRIKGTIMPKAAIIGATLLLGLGGIAQAAGVWSTYSATMGAAPFTGNEFAPFDTTLGSGQNPQTEGVSLDALKAYMYSNAGTSSLTANGTATATAGAATLNSGRGVVTSESITTAAGADYTLTLTNSHVLATSIVQATAANGTNTTEGLAINRVQPAAGSVIIHVRNTNASAALNGTIKIAYIVVN